MFSGGTTFNAASAEMASRIVGGKLGVNIDGKEAISRSNSINRLMGLMAMASTDSTNMASSLNHPANNLGGVKVWDVLPVTDGGGSTAEIVRVLGGPALRDICSRLLRLTPGTTREARTVGRLLSHLFVSMQLFQEKKRVGAETK